MSTMQKALATTALLLTLTLTGCSTTGGMTDASTASQTVAVPNLVNLTIAEAEALAEESGFTLKVTGEADADVVIVAQGTAPEARIQAGDVLRVTTHGQTVAERDAQLEAERVAEEAERVAKEAAAQAEAAAKAQAEADVAATVEAAYQAAVPTLDHWVGSLMGYDSWRTTFCTLTPDFLRSYGEQYSKMLEGVTADHFVRYTTEKCALG